MIEDKNFKVGNLCVQFASFHIFMQYISRWASFFKWNRFFLRPWRQGLLIVFWQNFELASNCLWQVSLWLLWDAVLVFLHNPSRGSTHNFDQCRRSWLFPAKKVSTVVNHFVKLKTPCNHHPFIWNSAFCYQRKVGSSHLGSVAVGTDQISA